MLHRTRTLQLAASLLAAGLIVAAGCGDKDPALKSPDSGSLADTGTSPDVGDDSSSGPEVVASVDIRLDPSFHVYDAGDRVEARALVRDSDGNLRSDIEVGWSHSPKELAAKTGRNKFRFEKEGIVTLEACATLAVGTEVCGTREITIDDGPPSLKLTKPKAGAIIDGSNSSQIQVEGTATDSHGEVSVYLGDKKLDVDDQGNFSTTLEPSFGVNSLKVTATDGLNRSDTVAIRDVLWAPAFSELSTDNSQLSVEMSDGVAVDLGQNFFDDAAPPKRNSMDSKLITKDFADILTVLIKNIDLTKQIPNPVLDSSSAKLRVNSVALGSPDVTIDVTDKGVDFFLHVDSLVIQTAGNVSLEGQKLDLTGTVTGRVSAFAELSVTKKSTEFDSQVDEVSISIDEVKPSFADQKANAIFQLAESALRSKLEERLVTALEGRVVDSLPQLLTQTLNSLESSLTDQTFSFDSSLTGQRTIEFDGEIGTFETNYRESLFALLATDLSTSGSDIHPDSPGVPRLVPSSGMVPLFDQSRIQIGVRMALLNGMLTAFWKSSYLELDLSEQLPEDLKGLVSEAKVSGKMPPVIRPAKESEPYDLIMEAGQIEIEADALNKNDTYGLNLKAGLNVSLKDNKLSLTIPDKPEIEAWVIAHSEDEPFLEGENLRELILTNVWPEIQKSLKGGLNLPIPVPNLSNLSSISPTLKDMKMSFALERPIDVRKGYLLFDSALRGEIPLGQ